ncbi:ATPase, T2SS/T4P/T4SS family [Trinickia mobilis]|uniref:ATPase, T2SS/T4P/T4SS family n=1 Tax=Trinickia mobilis TaxID=2816356 RepID=UPI001A8E6449|nr:ATPase, T2SS/T4P/T4SS family [Trinickia mobilis]
MTNLSEAVNLADTIEDPSKVRERLATWGYTPDEAPAELVEMAKLSLSTETLRVGDLVVQLGYADRPEVEKLLESKPKNVLTLNHLAEHIDNLRPHIQKMLALTEGRAFYTILPASPSHLLANELIRQACNEYEAVLIDTPSGRPCLVFTECTRLKEYEQMARDKRANDHIYQTCKDGPILAVGQRTEIYRLLSSDTADMIAIDQEHQTRSFTPDQASTEVQKLLVRMLDYAASKGSSNIALQPQRDGIVLVRYRRSGNMYEMPVVPRLNPEQARELNQFLHRISGARYTDTQALVEGRLQAPADGQFIYKSQEAEIFLRLGFTPPDSSGLAFSPESVSIRLIPRSTARVSLKDMKIKQSVITELKNALSETMGMILLVGPTNSGKSTTIAGALTLDYEMHGDTKNRLSAEQPVERSIPGVVQHTIDHRNTYDLMVAAMLRQDPNLAYIGEIRSRSSAAAAVRAAGTGSMVLSTAHANDAILAYPVLRAYISNTHVDNATAAMVTEHDLIEAMNLVVAQRLIPRLCQCATTIERRPFDDLRELTKAYCKKHSLPVPSEHQFKQLAHSKVRNPKGCLHCDGTGFDGVVPINETLVFSRELKNALHDMAERGTFHYAQLTRFRERSLFDAAIERVLLDQAQLPSLLI